MIVERLLNASERRSSQNRLCFYWCFTALGMACCGDAVLPLLAMELGISDAVTSMLGAMNYGCFLLLPLGFWAGGRYGAGRSMYIECAVMALAALLLAGSGALASHWLFFGGLAVYLVSRAANFAMRFSLQQNIAVDAETPAMLARNYIGMHSCSLIGFLLVSLVLYLFKGGNTMPLVLAAGGVFFFLAGKAIGGVFESESVRRQAAAPVRDQVKKAWQEPLIRQQIYVGCLLNLMLAAVVPVNILSARRGAGADASLVVMLTAVQALAAVSGCVLVRKVTQKFGPRTMMLTGYPLLWMLCLCWIFMPEQPGWWYLLIPFVLSGILLMAFGTSLENYFLLSVRPDLQIGGTFLVFVVTGGVTGAVGMLMNWLIFKLSAFVLPPDAGSMDVYHFYYSVIGTVFAAGILLPWSLPEKSVQKKG
ncbi:MAG: MFS transporter [Lentisphaerae bacterium]|nr:MFS transporter [Lentisphaerota bacterium]